MSIIMVIATTDPGVDILQYQFRRFDCLLSHPALKSNDRVRLRMDLSLKIVVRLRTAPITCRVQSRRRET